MDIPPSDAELEVLKALWRCGPMSAREVQAAVAKRLAWTDSTTRTVLLRMSEKKLVSRKSLHGLAVYETSRGKVEVLADAVRRVVRDLLENRDALPASSFTGSALLTEAEASRLSELLNVDSKEAGKS